MEKYILYGGRFTRALITQMVMAEGQIDYVLKEIDIVNKQHLSKEYLAINPAGMVPALITPAGETIFETPAINLYLVDCHPVPHLAPGLTDADRGAFLSGLFFISGELEPIMKRYFYPHRYVVDKDQASKMRRMALQQALERLIIIDQRLTAGGPYYLGAQMSLVDLMLTYWAESIAPGDTLKEFSGVNECSRRVADRPALGNCFEQLRNMREEYVKLQGSGKRV